ncbi:MAG: serine protease [Gemmatimonadetes bacterium]|nr:serine protease [Gemmatimonadota bacterium]
MNSLSSSFPWVALAAVLALPATVNAQGGLGRDEVNRISRAVVRIVTLDGDERVSSGSGTLTEPTGQIYTNRHVVEGGEDYEIQILDDLNDVPVPVYLARLVGYSSDVDFAILQIDRDVDGRAINAEGLSLPSLSVSEPDVQRGDRVFVFGYPGIGEGYLALTDGAVTTIRNGTVNDQRMPVWYQTDAEISPGTSGGLAVNSNSEMVGIPTQVLTENTTGGRLGAILSISAVVGAIESGLDSDRGSIAEGTTSPVIEGGRLDFNQEPSFGSVSLAAGFSADPHTVKMPSGGEVNGDYLGGGCTGYAAVAPDYRLSWSGRSSELRIFFAAEGGRDTALLINRPDGSWVCNDDAASGVLDPMIALDGPATGQYDIWVASYSAGDFIDGTLYITERDLEPTTVGPDELDPSQDAYFGTSSLRAGFRPDPYSAEITAGGTVNVDYLGGSCVGYAASAPDLQLSWSGRSARLRIFFEAEGELDTTIVVRSPGGDWSCNDDANSDTLSPLVAIDNPSAGRYDIWVGSYGRGEFIKGKVRITEMDLGPQ